MTDTARYMQDPERRQRRAPGGERELLERFLDFERDTLLWKVSGLTEAQLRQPRTPTGMTLLGLVNHLAYVERNWFQFRFLGREVYIPWRRGLDRGQEFQIAADQSADSIFAFYRAEIEESRRILAATDSLDTLAVNTERNCSMRWILIHMIEETARHCGHADLMREFTDGQTGE